MIGRPTLRVVAVGIAALLGFPACNRSPGEPAAPGVQIQVSPPAAHPDPLAALSSPDATLAANKRLAFDMWRSIVNAGHIELADQMLAEGYIQHSPVLPTGRAAFKQIFSVVPRREIPELVAPPLVHSVAEGDLVVMALAETVPAREGVPGHVTTHFNLFRVDNGRLAEHWHSVQAEPGPDVPAPGQGGPQPVTGVTGAAQLELLESPDPALAANKRLVFDMWRELVDAARPDAPGRYLGPVFTEHSAGTGAGHAPFGDHGRARTPAAVHPAIGAPLVAVVAERDLVVLVTMREHSHPSRAGATYTTTWFDMFRMVEGRIVEHWDGG